MSDIKNNDRYAFIDTIQEWFRQRNKFWGLISVLSFFSLIVLQIIFVFAESTNLKAGQQTDFLVVPILALFVVSIFWRGSVQTFLSLTSSLIAYVGMFYLHARYAGLEILPPIITNRLGVGKIAAASNVNSIADLYFFSGMFIMALCLAISFKSNFFRAKGARYLPYPIWTNSKINFSTKPVGLIPVTGLLSFAESHLAANYKYITAMIAGTFYFVSPDDWVPEGTSIVRDKESGSLLGVPKVPDGFNIW